MRASRKITNFLGSPWKTIGVPGIRTRCGRCANPKYWSGRKTVTESSSSISTRTVESDHTDHRERASHATSGSTRAGVCNAVDQPSLSAGSLSVHRSRIPDHHLSDGSSQTASGCTGTVGVRRARAAGQYKFIRMPNSTGFGDYTETGQVIPVSFRGRKGGYTLCMFLNDEGPIAGGRELWGFPKKLANPKLQTEVDTLVGTLDYGPVRVATGTMGYKHRQAELNAVKASLETPNFLLKIIPHVDGSPRICELVEYHLEDVVLKGAWTGPAALALTPHALAPVAELPVVEVVSAVHILADLTLGLGKVVHDYMS